MAMVSISFLSEGYLSQFKYVHVVPIDQFYIPSSFGKESRPQMLYFTILQTQRGPIWFIFIIHM